MEAHLEQVLEKEMEAVEKATEIAEILKEHRHDSD